MGAVDISFEKLDKELWESGSECLSIIRTKLESLVGHARIVIDLLDPARTSSLQGLRRNNTEIGGSVASIVARAVEAHHACGVLGAMEVQYSKLMSLKKEAMDDMDAERKEHEAARLEGLDPNAPVAE